MKLVIFSDTHLSHKFDSKKYHFLKKIIKDADQIIINGDFWDSWRTTFDKFVHSGWNKLFPLLKQKKTVYIHGNHDPQHKCDHRKFQFCETATDTLAFTHSKLNIQLIHGDKLTRRNRPKLIEQYATFLEKIEQTPIQHLCHQLLNAISGVGCVLLGRRYTLLFNIAKNNNKIMKSTPRDNNVWLICGDSHYPEVDQAARYANSGYIQGGYFSYLLADNDTISLSTGKY